MLKIMGRLLITMASVVLISGCVTTGEVEKKYPVGTIVRDMVKLGSKQIPLPPGDWEVYGVAETQSSLGSPLNTLVLVNNRNRRLPSAVALFSNVEGAGRGDGGWVSLKTCSRNDMIHRTTEQNTAGGRQACWYINHTRMTRTGRTPAHLRAALDRVIEKGGRLPLTSVYVGMHLADSFDYLTVRYYYNPEADGFPPPRVTDWRSNDWHHDRLHEDPKKIEYVDMIKGWGASWFSRLKAGFSGKLGTMSQTLKTK